MNEFNDLKINELILKAIKESGYINPTPIQKQAIPKLLEGADLLASAQTGTGKTAAFAIPMIEHINNLNVDAKKHDIKGLILTPTRELANQIFDNFNNYSKYLKIKTNVIYGGVSQKRQEDNLAKGTDILVATPGRLLDLINQRIINLSKVKFLVLDEADQMLDMGFIKDVYRIIKYIPKERQTMLFSATMPKSIEELSNDILNNPIRVAVTPVAKTLDVITQELYYVPKKQKLKLLFDLIVDNKMTSVLVFAKTKRGANAIAKDLIDGGMNALAIHGNKSQNAREKALDNFKKGTTRVLVATDIAARGIDIDKLQYVFNYDLPDTPETYIHRIGRTGRAGELGKSISFCDPSELGLLKEIEKHIKQKITVITDHPDHIKNIESQKVTPKSNSNKNSSSKNTTRSNNNFGNKRSNQNKSKTNNDKNKKRRYYPKGNK
ncbi:DEAD/DEAH box helicase [Haploplasma axanthum]|uniref:RNA helicase n=1 Tax=Haploplasma axanthum TaxID=29552 RepID=A0A449BEF9_HAPAX|nr:DEAD/DEAH box helicase [Haploplasma axanthum]VEU80843.1 DEAD-box ATP-dependent RNA helicase [Haploplasma axanthum]